MVGWFAMWTPNHNAIVAGTILRIGVSPAFPSAIFRHKRRGLRARAVRMLGLAIGRGWAMGRRLLLALMAAVVAAACLPAHARAEGIKQEPLQIPAVIAGRTYRLEGPVGRAGGGQAHPLA